MGFGVYEWVARMSSTSATPDGVGTAKSGSVSGLFNHIGVSETEIDIEAEGQYPDQLDLTTKHTLNASQTSDIAVGGAHCRFHTYRFMWSPGVVLYYVNGLLYASHVLNTPIAPANVMMNHWGTNSASFGGIATPDVDRYMFVKRFTFTPR